MFKKSYVWLAFFLLFVPVFLLSLFLLQLSWNLGICILVVLAVFPVLFFFAVFYYFISACLHNEWEKVIEWKEDP